MPPKGLETVYIYPREYTTLLIRPLRASKLKILGPRSFIKYGKLLERLILKSESLGGRDGTPGDGFGMQKLFLRIRIDSVVV